MSHTNLTPIPGIDLVRAVRKIAKERPDVTYRETVCHYTRGKCSDETLGCLIGQALLRVGVGEDLLTKIDAIVKDEDGNTFNSAASCVLKNNLRNVVKATELQCAWLDVVQNQQDNGFTWKQAVLSADTETGL